MACTASRSNSVTTPAALVVAIRRFCGTPVATPAVRAGSLNLYAKPSEGWHDPSSAAGRLRRTHRRPVKSSRARKTANIYGRRATLPLPLVDSDSTIATELRSAAAAGRFSLFEEQRIERGYAYLGDRFNVWDGVSRRRRHDLQRRERRLTELGNVAVTHCAHAGDAPEYADQFLALEAAGWKGDAGTALAQHSVNSRYFKRLCHEAADRGALRATKIALDGRPVAIIISLVSPPQSYAVRMAYDESYAPHSPGHLLVRRHLEWLAGQPNITGSDSCANPNSQMANANWRDRKSLSNFVVSVGTS